MPRIRTIKPSFWTDEKIGKLPVGARLLFIGLWNLADDEGIVVWNASYIRGQLFPYDVKITMVSIKQWMDNIASLKLVAVLEDAQKNSYGYIRAWHKHQVINRPQPTEHKEILAMINNLDSLNTHGAITASSLTEKEGRGREKEKEGNATTTAAKEKLEENIQLKKEEVTQPLKKDVEFSAVVVCYEQNIGLLTPAVAETLKDIAAEYPAGWFALAVKEACNAGVRKMNYISKILERWKIEGLPTERSPDNQPRQSASVAIPGLTIEDFGK